MRWEYFFDCKNGLRVYIHQTSFRVQQVIFVWVRNFACCISKEPCKQGQSETFAWSLGFLKESPEVRWLDVLLANRPIQFIDQIGQLSSYIPCLTQSSRIQIVLFCPSTIDEDRKRRTYLSDWPSFFHFLYACNWVRWSPSFLMKVAYASMRTINASYQHGFVRQVHALLHLPVVFAWKCFQSTVLIPSIRDSHTQETKANLHHVVEAVEEIWADQGFAIWRLKW
jgi:hypothetical protein